MSKCLECGIEVPQTVGKRAKQYCGNNCRVKYHLKKKNEGKVPKKRGRKPKSITEQITPHVEKLVLANHKLNQLGGEKELVKAAVKLVSDNIPKKSAADQLQERLNRMEGK